MKLLIVTQAVDRNDPALGFFHRWIEEFAKRCEAVTVICLKEGEHRLPSNARVFSLGKERGVSRFGYVRNFYRLIWWERKNYDAVFVHMNQEYVLLGGMLWRLWGKQLGLWRNHRKGSWTTLLACWFCDVVFFTSPDAYVAGQLQGRRMPIGIDLEAFSHIPNHAAPGTLLVISRLDPVKRLDLVLAAVRSVSEIVPDLRLDIYGEPTVGFEAYAAGLRSDFARLEERGVAWYHGAVRHTQTPPIYAAHAVFVNVTGAGSFDKTIGEAMAAGCVVVSSNIAAQEGIDPRLLVRENDAEDLAKALQVALTLSPEDRERILLRQRAFVERHSLHTTVEDVLANLSAA